MYPPVGQKTDLNLASWLKLAVFAQGGGGVTAIGGFFRQPHKMWWVNSALLLALMFVLTQNSWTLHPSPASLEACTLSIKNTMLDI
jgi:hypothetical protein